MLMGLYRSSLFSLPLNGMESASIGLKSLNHIMEDFGVDLFPITHHLAGIKTQGVFSQVLLPHSFFISHEYNNRLQLIDYICPGAPKIIKNEPTCVRAFMDELFLKSATLNGAQELSTILLCLGQGWPSNQQNQGVWC